ncbi:hypothetical protein GCM10010211_17160 [Streptomyces albospinus]|uniref:Uncharacterized protein n=1 Tax=Streptomyces albospinus TaxID=285515 RepID=A0ABQ2UTJ8_9ACTN|nr:hypothetical protein [Streptomyces albospinus]GGU53096.1 hypothetical protein GCM10010211_17160 [Streptomyces albospinus]
MRRHRHLRLRAHARTRAGVRIRVLCAGLRRGLVRVVAPEFGAAPRRTAAAPGRPRPDSRAPACC